MLELQSCASLASSSALCAMGQEVRGESVNVIAEISAELVRERQRNAELMERISVLEAQTQGRDKESLLVGQGSCPSARERSFKNLKRQKIERSSYRTEDGNIIKSQIASQMKHDTQHIPPKDASLEGCLVNWMSMDDNQLLHLENFKNGDSGVDCDDSDDNDSDEGDDYYEDDDTKIDLKDSEIDTNKRNVQELKDLLEGVDEGMHIPCWESSFGDQSEPVLLNVGEQTTEGRKKDCVLPNTRPVYKKKKFNKNDEKQNKKIAGYKAQAKIFTSRNIGSGSLSLHKMPRKMAFCPKEVKRILESPALLLKNAQSHTIRKIIVFASLGIRHGCEDMYELDFNHFSILRKGEPYVSPDNPGEHVLYDNPGVGRKIFYPNRQNPTLCPVQTLEEEKAMRPSDASCPSCLFLCIKYGGRTRNLPQNEYVRQRMGRNKLKSFGPAMCRMAMLVHIRSGSFFFKALGITLLFMAGFPDDLVQRETKYQNLDLLQKYYRTDEDAEGEELFLPHALTCDTPPGPGPQQSRRKISATKSKSKKQTHSTSKSHNLQTSSIQQSAPLSSAPSSQFGLRGYTSIHTHAMAAFQSMPSQTAATLPVSNPVITNSGIDVSYHNQTPYHMFPPQLSNAFMPMMYWPPPNTFPPCPYPASFGYRSFPSTGSYISIHPQPYYGHPCCSPSITKMVEGVEKNDVASEEADGDSDSSSSSTKPKEALASCN